MSANGGRRSYVSKRRTAKPEQFASSQHIEGRTFTDQDGTEYQVVWPRGRMPLSELHEVLMKEASESE